MNYNNFVVFLSLIFTILLIEIVSSLSTEGIVNGIIADQSEFVYQVGILGRQSATMPDKLLCNAALVAAGWLLGVARCFMLTSITVKKLIFTAVVGSTNLNTLEGFPEYIEFIYTMNYSAEYDFNDIVMAKPQHDFVLSDRINKVAVATPEHWSTKEPGVVSGYGSSKIISETYPDGNTINYQAESDLQLRQTFVTLESYVKCAEYFLAYRFDKFCGISVHNEGEPTGVAFNDIGCPLVNRNGLVGLSYAGYALGDDTKQGSMYYDVSQYYQFVQDTIDDKIGDSWQKHDTYLPADLP